MLARRVSSGWTAKAAAEAAGVSLRTARKWIGRHRRGGERRHHDRSSAPRRCPRRVSQPRVAEIERMRHQRMTGPAIARVLGMARSTVGAILRRLGLGKLSLLEPRPQVIRYERDRPGEMIHLDIKKLGKINGNSTLCREVARGSRLKVWNTNPISLLRIRASSSSVISLTRLPLI